jgi:hypothetical protein
MVQGKAPAGDAAGRHTKQHSKGMRLQAEATAALLGAADYDEEEEDDDFDVDGRVSEDEEDDEDEDEEDEEEGEAAAAAGEKKRKARSGGGAKKRGASAFIDDAAAEDDDEEEEEEVRCGVCVLQEVNPDRQRPVFCRRRPSRKRRRRSGTCSLMTRWRSQTRATRYACTPTEPGVLSL